MSQEFLNFLYTGDIKIIYPYVYEDCINIEGEKILIVVFFLNMNQQKLLCKI